MQRSGGGNAPDWSKLEDELVAVSSVVWANLRLMEAMLAGMEAPEHTALGSLRLQFSRSLGRHLRLLREQILPVLAKPSTGRRVRLALQEYHEQAAHHVAAWPSVNVAADWAGYVRSATAMLERLRHLLELERSQVHPILAAEASATMAAPAGPSS